MKICLWDSLNYAENGATIELETVAPILPSVRLNRSGYVVGGTADADPDASVALISAHPLAHNIFDNYNAARVDCANWLDSIAQRSTEMKIDCLLIDHPRPEYGYRRDPKAISFYQNNLLEEAMARFDFPVAQYGVNEESTGVGSITRSVTLWTDNAMVQAAGDGTEHFYNPPMGWVKGPYQWSRQGISPDLGGFVFSLYAAKLAGLTHCCVWFDSRARAFNKRIAHNIKTGLETYYNITCEDAQYLASGTGNSFDNLIQVLSNYDDDKDGFKGILKVLGNW